MGLMEHIVFQIFPKSSQKKSNMENVEIRKLEVLSLYICSEPFGVNADVQNQMIRRIIFLLKFLVFCVVSKLWKHVVSKYSYVTVSHKVLSFEKVWPIILFYDMETYHTIIYG